MHFEGFNYYRYVDDIRIFVESETQARRAIIKLTEFLRPLNLHLNSGKTELIDYSQHKSSENTYTKEMEAAEYNIALGSHMYSFADIKLKQIWKEAISDKKFNKYLFNYCIKRFTKIESDFPLEDILVNNLYDPAFSKEICEYLVSYINLKEVQLKVVEIINNGLYEFQTIWLIKTLLLAKKIHFELRKINKNKLLQYNNFMITGYYFILITKFGNIGEKEAIHEIYKSLFVTNLDLTRYYILGLIHYSDDRIRINSIFTANPFLEYLRGKTYPKYFI
jgi:hypothetical protein